MGSPSTKKFLKNNNGTTTEEAAIISSAGSADANKIPALDSSGRLDVTFMPTGIGADTGNTIASEALSANDLVNIWSNGGVHSVRKADGSSKGKEAHGFVLSAVAIGEQAKIYFEGTNAGLTGILPGIQYLSDTVPGKSTTTPPTAAGHIVQVVGFGFSANAINFQYNNPIELA